MDIELKIDEEKINRGFVDLKKASAIAARNTLNILAANTRRFYQENLKKDLTLRNDFTTRSIVFDKAVGENLSSMASQVGALQRASYLDLQEDGGTRKPKRGNVLAIPQVKARGGSIRRRVATQYYLKRISKQKVTGAYTKNFSSKKAMAVARAYVAYNKKKIIHYNSNIYAVTSFHKTSKRVKFNKIHLYNTSKRSANVKGIHAFRRAVYNDKNNAQAIYNGQMKKLLRSKEII